MDIEDPYLTPTSLEGMVVVIHQHNSLKTLRNYRNKLYLALEGNNNFIAQDEVLLLSL